jgi:hypothetical protein
MPEGLRYGYETVTEMPPAAVSAAGRVPAMFHVLLLTTLLSIVPGSAPMSFTTLHRGTNSQIDTARTVVIRKAADWPALWREHAGDTKPPAVDFAKAMVIAVFAGMRPTGGYAVEITQIESRDGGVVVTYRERRPSPEDIVTQALTAPFHIVSAPAQAGPVTFQERR